MDRLDQSVVYSREHRRKLDNLLDEKKAYNYDINDTYGGSLKMPANEMKVGKAVHETTNNYFYGKLP